MKRNTGFLILFLSAVLSLSAFEPADISRDLEKILDGSPVPSLAAAVVTDGRIAAAGAAGIRKKGAPEGASPEDKYHIGSCTKSMTASLAAILVRDGVLSWDTTAGEVFTDLEIHPGYRDATLRQLVTNTGGAPEQIEESLWAQLWEGRGTPAEQRMQLVRGILSEPPVYPPGTGYAYSNAGFSIAGAMLEKLTGESWEDLMTEKLFIPLGMSSAGFRAPASAGTVDQPYGHVRKLFRVIAVDPEPAGDNPAAIAPAGAVHCSVTDLARYAQFHLGTLGESLLSEEERAVLYRPAGDGGYAMGWIAAEREWAGGTALTHAGSNTMFYAVIWLAPERNFAAVAMCNLGGQEGFSKCDEAVAYLIGEYLE